MAIRGRIEEIDLPEFMIDAAPSILFAVDPEGRVIRWNRAAADFTGISADQIRGRAFHETALFPDDRDRAKGQFDRSSAGHAPWSFESRWKNRDGSFVLQICSCSVVRDPAQKVRYIVCSLTNSMSAEIMADHSAKLRDISRFLHDTISQNLVALSFRLSPGETGAPGAASTLGLIDRCCRDIRVISYMLAPPALPETTLEEAIGMQAEFVSGEIGLAIALDLDPVPDTVPSEARLLVFAAVQSWIAHAIRCRVKPETTVRLRKRGGGTVLELEMAPRVSEASMTGWAVIRERARALGGRFDIAGDSNRMTAGMFLPGAADEGQSDE